MSPATSKRWGIIKEAVLLAGAVGLLSVVLSWMFVLLVLRMSVTGLVWLARLPLIWINGARSLRHR